MCCALGVGNADPSEPHRLGIDAFVKHFYVKSQPMTEADFEKLTKMTVLEVSLSLLFSLARHGAP